MLTFNLKKEWFEKIKSGEKTHEYRKIKPYWDKRLYKLWQKYKGKVPCCFACGYPKKDDKEKRIYGYITKITSVYGRHTDLKIEEPVFDIEFKLIKEN